MNPLDFVSVEAESEPGGDEGLEVHCPKCPKSFISSKALLVLNILISKY
jgi:hypothetical protein